MKPMTASEKFALIRMHGNSLATAGAAVRSPLRSEMLDSAERIIALIKSISKHEFGIEE